MIWVIFLVVAAVLLAGWLIWRHGNPRSDEGTYQVIVALHLIRRRLDVSQFKIELRRDAARLRRELRDELDKRDRRRP
jgi:hypothetical protein